MKSPSRPGLEGDAIAFRCFSKATKGRVLLVEDEDVVRDVAGSMLHFLGYEVVAVARGSEAREIAAMEGQSFTVALLDDSLGDCETEALLAELRRAQPRLPVVLVSGRPAEELAPIIEAAPSLTLLSKPFTLNHLARVLTSLLG